MDMYLLFYLLIINFRQRFIGISYTILLNVKPLIDNVSKMIIDTIGIRGRKGVKHQEKDDQRVARCHPPGALLIFQLSRMWIHDDPIKFLHRSMVAHDGGNINLINNFLVCNFVFKIFMTYNIPLSKLRYTIFDMYLENEIIFCIFDKITI